MNPTVTIGIPVLNEEDHIEKVVSGFLSSNYSNLVEILIADGGSKDKTREIVKRISEKDKRVKLIENKEKFQSFALNKMIDQAKGEVFLRADGHCIYKEDYLEKNIEVFLETGAKNVGGAQRYIARNSVQAGTVFAVKNFLGNGGAKYMDENYEGYADTVFLGCFWTQDLREIGGFNTKNITNQDSELNLRFIEKFGTCVFISKKIKSWYFPRNTYSKLFRQYFRYGRGRFLTKLIHPKSSPIRGLIPFFFLSLLLCYLLLDLIAASDFYFLEFIVVLGVVVLFESLRTVIKYNDLFEREGWKSKNRSPGILTLWFHTAASIVVMQLGHFSGFMFQFLRRLFLGIKGW